MEIGNFVRTRYRGIWKLASIRYGARKYVYELEKYRNGIRCFVRVRKEDVVSSSKNIIDLIEDGDYVNGYKVLEIFKNNVVGESLIAFQNHNDTISSIYDDEIKSVVTKEQFNSAEYEVNE